MGENPAVVPNGSRYKNAIIAIIVLFFDNIEGVS
jgi:hypothetical protein